MSTFLRIDVNLVAMVLLGMVYYIATIRLDHEDAFNRLFFKGCIIIFTLMAFETTTCIINRHPSPWLRGISIFMHLCLFAYPPVITYYWYLVSHSLSTHGHIPKMKENLLFLIPIAVNCIVVLPSPITHWSFYIDQAGIYHRGPLFAVSSVCAYGYLLLSFVLLIIKRKNMIRREFVILLLSSLLPMVGGLIQGFVYGVLLMWSASACALVIIYLYLQERLIQTDSLSGALTRNSFEAFVSRNLKGNTGKPFGLIYADIDNLKPINDQYGHAEGDIAIRAAVKAIKSVLRKGDAIARLGGDEFAVHVSVSSMEDLQVILKRIEAILAQNNKASDKPYALSLSFGADMFYENAENTFDAMIRKVDYKMYNNKRMKKQQEQKIRE